MHDIEQRVAVEGAGPVPRQGGFETRKRFFLSMAALRILALPKSVAAVVRLALGPNPTLSSCSETSVPGHWRSISGSKFIMFFSPAARAQCARNPGLMGRFRTGC